jgi:hypothetical protein
MYERSAEVMKKTCLTCFLAISVNVSATDLVLLDCEMTTDKGEVFTFMELDWDKNAETADISYYDMNGNNKGSYTNVSVSSSAKTINFKSGVSLLTDQPTQFAEGQISRVDMAFTVGISTPLWRNNIGSNLMDLDGKCKKSDRQIEQAF